MELMKGFYSVFQLNMTIYTRLKVKKGTGHYYDSPTVEGHGGCWNSD